MANTKWGPYLVGCDGGDSVVRKLSGIPFPGTEPIVVGRMRDVNLNREASELLKKRVPQLGGKDVGIARTETGNFAIVRYNMEWQQPPKDHRCRFSLLRFWLIFDATSTLGQPHKEHVHQQALNQHHKAERALGMQRRER